MLVLLTLRCRACLCPQYLTFVQGFSFCTSCLCSHRVHLILTIILCNRQLWLLCQMRELKFGLAPPGHALANALAQARIQVSGSPAQPRALCTHMLSAQDGLPVVSLSLSLSLTHTHTHTHTSLTHSPELSVAHRLVSFHQHLYLVLPFQSENTPGVLYTVNKTELLREWGTSLFCG